MIRNSMILDELARLASGAAGSALELKREVEGLVSAKIEQIAANMKLVSREEFEITQQMASRAREENTKLALEVQNLQNQLNEIKQKFNL